MNNALTPEQTVWMKANKPARYTGKAMSDIPHLPAHLRCA
jgi:hypothetical protein